MDILTQSATLLKHFDYAIAIRDFAEQRAVYFEDESLLGIVWVDELNAILAGWEMIQDRFIRENAPKLRRSLAKTWNLYVVFLTNERASEDKQRLLSNIQEDFRGARKIVQSGITGEAQLIRALYPLLPIQNLVSLDSEDPAARIRGRLQQIPATALDALVSNDQNEEDILKVFLSAHEITTD